MKILSDISTLATITMPSLEKTLGIIPQGLRFPSNPFKRNRNSEDENPKTIDAATVSTKVLPTPSSAHHPNLAIQNQRLHQAPLFFPEHVEFASDVHSKDAAKIVDALIRTAELSQTKAVIDDFRTATLAESIPVKFYFTDRDAAAENGINFDDQGSIQAIVGFSAENNDWFYENRERTLASTIHNEYTELQVALDGLKSTGERGPYASYEKDFQLYNGALSEIIDDRLRALVDTYGSDEIERMDNTELSTLLNEEISTYFVTEALGYDYSAGRREIQEAINREITHTYEWNDDEGSYDFLRTGYDSRAMAEMARDSLQKSANALGSPGELVVGDYVNFVVRQDKGKYYLGMEFT